MILIFRIWFDYFTTAIGCPGLFSGSLRHEPAHGRKIVILVEIKDHNLVKALPAVEFQPPEPCRMVADWRSCELTPGIL
jgi:hypothetical protein